MAKRPVGSSAKGSAGGSGNAPSVPGRGPGKTGENRPGAATTKGDAATAQTARSKAVSLRTARGRTTAQQRWLSRQLNDPYVVAARKQGWRSRAAFKLIELDDKYKLIRPGMRVIDLGTAPGGWAQVAVKRGATHVVGVDLLPVEPVRGAEIIQGDFNDPDLPSKLRDMLGGPADIVLSDMAPNTTGHSPTDHMRIIDLAELALFFAMEVLVEGGSFIAKVFQGGSEKQMLIPMKQAFAVVRHAKPPASRKESSELYVVATGFRPDRAQVLRDAFAASRE
ncbi:RlmE family RNA methyltransferase [Lichenicola cladoniae]|uniref:Ribosomal RNA large subunit methyltransferase E n=1 Tax=Lichenicola cladoniae TaxID=1484109 RepID=A0A6M8HPH6_9PROT|nr:RlmE family RNA methyltransferase [Lichenicola cladoniae]NPD66537.1 RlmE family RNA methyltransferase [Acetobacteraceae bacterium]QKE90248.1 RlmE family RNA methyltransferase [Lichenicola cladoniae]